MVVVPLLVDDGVVAAVVVPVDVVELVDVALLVDVVVDGGAGAPAVGGRVDVPAPVTNAPLFGFRVTNA